MEGGIMMGISSVLKETNHYCRWKSAAIQFSMTIKYYGWKIFLTKLKTELIASNVNPEGVGETATPMVACAIANAFFWL